MHPNPFRQTRFLLSVDHPRDLPPDTGAEVAIIGRSNVGKSSLLNALCEQRALARVSRTPGRTQQIVVFEIAEQQRFLDLPGFGYAAVSRAVRSRWEVTLPVLLEQRAALCGLLLVTDARAPLKAEEHELLQWCAASHMPCLVALNKADKLGNAAAQLAWRALNSALAAVTGLNGTAILSSVTKGQGLEAIRAELQALLGRNSRRKLKEGPGFKP